MSAEQVTTEKPKNPGRQAWGRKVGKMPKLKKQTSDQSPVEEPVINTTRNSVKWEYALGLAAVVVGAAALYYQKKSYENHQPMVITTENKNVKFSDF
jgi:hypothetical protein